ncbi:MAG: hypothetical protein MI806_27260, partial [Minwuiales bacterium]|nr:hypothetical protein [Minwuiales bacterium]
MTAPQLRLAVRGRLRSDFEARAARLGQQVVRAVNDTAETFKQDKRAAARRGGLSGGLVNAIRVKRFENDQIDAAALVFVRGRKGQEIFDLFIRGGRVRPRSGRFLVIPQ